MKVVKMCDMPAKIAVKVFDMLNPGKMKITYNLRGSMYIQTDTEPKALIYPEGWYYAKGCFRSKYKNPCSGEELPLIKSNGREWGDTARYCTLD